MSPALASTRMTTLEKLLKEMASLVMPNVEKTKIYAKYTTYTTKVLIDLLERGTIRISSELQRSYVWDDVRASQFIESIILGLPIPPIMLAKVGDTLYVVDGVQRLTTIQRFVKNQLRLVGVSPTLKNKRYETLTRAEKNKFDTHEIPIIIVEVEGDRESALLTYVEIFRRINLGAKPMTFTQVLFCSVPTTTIMLVKDVARSEPFRRLFQPSEVEEREMRHYYVSLCLHLAFLRGEPLNLIGSFKQRYIRDLVTFLFRSDIVDKAVDASNRLMATIELAVDLGFEKKMFSPSLYAGTTPKKLVVNPILAQAILLALYENAEKKMVDGRLKLELEVDDKEEFKKGLIDIIRSQNIDGKPFKTYWSEIVKNGRVETLRKFYDLVREAVKTLIG